MTTSYPVADLFASIRNALMAKRVSCFVRHSSLKEDILRVLRDEGYIDDFSVSVSEDLKKSILISLKYYKGDGAIKKIKVVSLPGRRVYCSFRDLRVPYFNGLGIRILTTSKGVMTDREARHQRVGGELLCNCF